MGGSVAERKRLVRVTAENIRKGAIDLSGHADFFRAESVSPDASDRSATERFVKVIAGSADEPIRLAIPMQPVTAAEIILSGRAVKAFFERFQIRIGDVLAIEKKGADAYCLSPFESKGDRDTDWHKLPAEPPDGTGPTVLELFAGCGGMAYGFKAAGYRTALAVEWDAAACESLRANITDRVAQCSIQEVDRFPSADVIAGGPPCQGFSNLGEKVPDDPRNQLWMHFMRAVEAVRPRVFVMENVPPLLASQEFVEIKTKAGALGYRTEARVLNAADFGVPQTRKRAIIIGALGVAPTFPEPTHGGPSSAAEAALFSTRRFPWVTVREAIGDLPSIPDGENWHIGRNPTAMSLERYRHVPAGGNRWDLPQHLMPECWKKKTKGGTDLFGRLWWDRPSVTIRTEFYKPEKGRYLHPEAHRPITHREAARLQGFPDSFEFRGKKIQVGVQIGNACPPPLAEALARHVLRHFEHHAEGGANLEQNRLESVPEGGRLRENGDRLRSPRRRLSPFSRSMS